MAIALFPLTALQESVLEFMWAFYKANDQLPPIHVISAHFEWNSNNSAQHHLRSLEKKGYVEANTVGKHKFTALFHEEQNRKAASLAEEA